MKKYLLAFVALMGITTLVAQEATKSLYVIDGKVVSKAEFDQLKPETIQNVDIFKNIEGAVVVTTKSNASGVEDLRGKLQSTTVRINKQDGSAMVEENDEKVLVIGGQASVVTTKSKKTEVADPLILQKKKDGYCKAQVDSAEFAGKKNGMKRASKIFRGEDIYGEVTLKNIHRSRIAQIAEKL